MWVLLCVCACVCSCVSVFNFAEKSSAGDRRHTERGASEAVQGCGVTLI